MAEIELMVFDDFGEGLFGVQNLANTDIPIGTVLTSLQSRRVVKEHNFQFRHEPLAASESVALKIVAIDFWRKSFDRVPGAHKAGIRLEGKGIAQLTIHLRNRSEWVNVYLGYTAPG
jgi:hypothetical protein